VREERQPSLITLALARAVSVDLGELSPRATSSSSAATTPPPPPCEEMPPAEVEAVEALAAAAAAAGAAIKADTAAAAAAAAAAGDGGRRLSLCDDPMAAMSRPRVRSVAGGRATLNGYLLKRALGKKGAPVKGAGNWKRRWFELEHSAHGPPRLAYFESEEKAAKAAAAGDDGSKGSVRLSGRCTVSAGEADGGKVSHIFTLVSPEQGVTLHAAAETADEQQFWISGIGHEIAFQARLAVAFGAATEAAAKAAASWGQS
jgi:hypothetical protein